ncbi:hypothetical protein P153DRAFT_380972 [Dothidotthia symphoricarpi CBS 119687]|uniref:Endonuclease/exonuclease/phosphatase domain-containing protein n=1 Tax=Dothidotthia symphoricarpi CBS 119687 TaxID=1392245 RepID=A0A6A6AS85_9PLEO|nr:uncharacterized protein P153DRAFT_380972 [Dothidotthia symphoricarpi CBS 119687]KAF2133794.1 hypothetical protein P153DRAFT_380972 [Dothidotthia symphoricarpi CBS 119687]
MSTGPEPPFNKRKKQVQFSASPLSTRSTTKPTPVNPFDRHRKQEYFYPDDFGTWTSATKPEALPKASSESAINSQVVRLMSWNIDMSMDFSEERMRAALQYLDDITSSTSTDIPIVIFLQEMTTSDMKLIKASTWIYDRFFITDIDNSNWSGSFYGTTMLIDQRLKVKHVFRVPWISEYSRDGLFADIAISSRDASDSEEKVLRICNTHLDSLAASPPVRPRQLSTAATLLQDSSVACALLAGDLNAIQPFDRTLHSENELKDAYLELGGEEDGDEAYTWGYQYAMGAENMRRFPCCRMDKILFRGHVQPKGFQRIGIGATVAEDRKEEMREVGQAAWVTDHYGVMGDFELAEGWSLQSRVESGDSAASKPT